VLIVIRSNIAAFCVRAGNAAVTQMLMEKLPEIAAAVASPLSRIDRIVMVNTGHNSGSGVEQVTKGLTDVVAQIPAVVELLTGINLPELLKRVPGLKAEKKDEKDRNAA